MYEFLTLLALFLGPFIAYMLWKAVFPFKKTEALVTVIVLLILNAVAVFMLSEGSLNLTELAKAFVIVTVLDLAISLGIFLYNAVKNSTFTSMLKSSFARGQAAANYQIIEPTEKKQKSKPSLKRKKKIDPEINRSDSIDISKAQEQIDTGGNADNVDLRKDSTSRSCCYNCKFWTGNRQLLSAAGNFIQYENVSAKCAPGGGRQHTRVAPTATCRSFTKQFG